MKSKKVFGMLLLFSLSLNAVLVFSSLQQETECPELPSYSSPVEISAADAQRTVLDYKRSIPSGAITGGIVTGNSIESLFCAPGTNAIGYNLAKDAKRVIANGDVFIVLSGAEVTTNGQGQISSVRQTGTHLYISNDWCPPNCVLSYE